MSKSENDKLDKEIQEFWEKNSMKLKEKEEEEEEEEGEGTKTEVDINRGLVGFYPFKKNSDDESGNSNHGTVHGTAFTTDRFGNQDCALYFNGKDDYVEVNDNSSLDMHNGISISVWLRIKSQSLGGIVSKWKTEDKYSGSWLLYVMRGGKVRFQVSGDGNSGAFCVTSRTTLMKDRNYLITGTYSSSDNKIRLYIDGKEEGVSNSQKGSIFISNSKLLIGAAKYFKKFFLHGTIDNVRIYDRSLSKDEIDYLFALGFDNETIHINSTIGREQMKGKCGNCKETHFLLQMSNFCYDCTIEKKRDRIHKKKMEVMIYKLKKSNEEVKQLKEKMKMMEETMEKKEEERKCCICKDREISVVLFPCGHAVCCDECVEKITECPLDRKKKTGVFNIFYG